MRPSDSTTWISCGDKTAVFRNYRSRYQPGKQDASKRVETVMGTFILWHMQGTITNTCIRQPRNGALCFSRSDTRMPVFAECCTVLLSLLLACGARSLVCSQPAHWALSLGVVALALHRPNEGDIVNIYSDFWFFYKPEPSLLCLPQVCGSGLQGSFGLALSNIHTPFPIRSLCILPNQTCAIWLRRLSPMSNGILRQEFRSLSWEPEWAE